MSVLIGLVFIPALCVIAGYGVFQALGPRGLRLDMLTGLFVIGLAGMLCLGWIALVAAELGMFSAVAVVAVAVLLGAIGVALAAWRGARLRLTRAASGRCEVVFLAGLLLVTGILYARPHEFIFGGADAGVYVNLGANIARTGSWLAENPDFSALPGADLPMLFREQPANLIPRFYHLPGFYIADDDAGRITPQFFPLQSTWMALAFGLRGVWASLYLTPLWGILGVLAFYFTLRECLGVRLAIPASIFLGLISTQVWFARYPTAETLTQFLTFAGLYVFARYVRTAERWAATLAGLALGQVALARIDMYFLLGLLIVYPAYLYLRRRLERSFAYLALPMLAMTLHSIIHVAWQGWPYFYNTFFSNGLYVPLPIVVMAGVLLLIGVMAYLLLRRRVGEIDQSVHLQKLWRYGRTLLAIGLVVLALYAYFVRPAFANPQSERLYWYSDSNIPDVEPYNLVRLGWYLSPLGLVLGVAGIALLVREQFSEHSWALISVGLFFSVLYLYQTYNNPHHIYVMRRYVPVVIPFFALGMAYALSRLFKRGMAGRVLAVVLGLAQIGLLLYSGRVVIEQVDYRGGIGQFEAFAAQIPPDAIVLFNDDQAVGTAGIFGTPLVYLDEQTVFDLQEDHLDFNRLDALVMGWLADGRALIVVDGPLHVAGLCDRWRCTRLADASFDLAVLESSYEHFPTQIIQQKYLLNLYRVEAVP